MRATLSAEALVVPPGLLLQPCSLCFAIDCTWILYTDGACEPDLGWGGHWRSLVRAEQVRGRILWRIGRRAHYATVSQAVEKSDIRIGDCTHPYFS